MAVTLRAITDENRETVLALRVARRQERFIESVRSALARAAREPHRKPWFRAVYADEEPVGFVMCDVVPQPSESHGLWFLVTLLIDERHQRRGYGSEVVRQVAGLVRADGGTELMTSYVPGDGGPAGFFERLGFVPTSRFYIDGEVVLRLPLSSHVRHQ